MKDAGAGERLHDGLYVSLCIRIMLAHVLLHEENPFETVRRLDASDALLLWDEGTLAGQEVLPQRRTHRSSKQWELLAGVEYDDKCVGGDEAFRGGTLRRSILFGGVTYDAKVLALESCCANQVVDNLGGKLGLSGTPTHLVYYTLFAEEQHVAVKDVSDWSAQFTVDN